MLETMSGFDPKDSTSLDLPVPKWEAGLSSDIRGKRIGIPREYRIDGIPEEIGKVWDQGIEWMKDAGAEIVEVSLPHTKYALPTYYIIAQIGRAHVRTPVTNAHLVSRLLLQK